MESEKPVDHKLLLLQFCASLTLCDHMSDVAGDIDFVLKKMKFEDLEWNDLTELTTRFAEMDITTLRGTSLKE